MDKKEPKIVQQLDNDDEELDNRYANIWKQDRIFHDYQHIKDEWVVNWLMCLLIEAIVIGVPLLAWYLWW